jgi:hypothetical protein
MIAQNVAEIVSRHVTLSVEGIDRMYLNVFVAGLQYESGIVRFSPSSRDAVAVRSPDAAHEPRICILAGSLCCP